MLGYAFVSLTPEQVEARRKSLDQAGFQGYLLPILLLSSVYAIRIGLKQSIPSFSRESPQPHGTTVLYRRLNWILGNTYLPEFGPVHVQLFGIIYVSLLLAIIFKGTGNDYMHVTKAFGHVAVSQLPIHYLLSIKHPQSPITLATGLTHERLNAYHRLLGRIIHALLAVHAVLYVRFFIAINVLMKRVNDWDVRYGLIAFWTVNFIGLLTLPSIRKKAYHKVFYKSHIVLSLVLVIIVWLHVPYTRNYVAQAAFFWVSNGILRKGKMTETVQVTCRDVGGGLIKSTCTMKNGLQWESWVPGMHGYLNQSGFGPKSPFTVVDIADRAGQIEISFVAKNLAGPMTGTLGRAAVQHDILKLELEGPYGEAGQYIPNALKRSSEPTLVVAGGVGATYALPIYMALAEKRQATSELKFVWIVRRVEDTKWGIDMLRGKGSRNVQVFVTQGKGREKAIQPLELPGIKILDSGARPEFSKILKDFAGPEKRSYQPFSVMVCGPPGLSRELRRATSQYVWTGRKVRWHEEQFGFGGS